MTFTKDESTVEQIEGHLAECNTLFEPALSSHVTIPEYARKIATRATRFEAWQDGILVGLVACYYNDFATGKGFITSVSVVKKLQGAGIARRLVADAVNFGISARFKTIALEVQARNSRAVALYSANGFKALASKDGKVTMERFLH